MKKIQPLTFLKDVFIPVPPARPSAYAEHKQLEAIRSVTQSQLGTVSSSLENKNKIGSTTEKYVADSEVGEVTELGDDSQNAFQAGRTHRNLNMRQLQLIAIGGAIGVGLYVQSTRTLVKAGPLGLLLGAMAWSFPVLCVTLACAEMVCYLPIYSPFVTMSERCIDEAFGFMGGWNFWALQGSLIPLETTLLDALVHYWATEYNSAIVFVCVIVAYFLINLCPVKYYGELEFWLGITKVLLALGTIMFGFITMVGGNPKHDVYGFRNWQPPMGEYIHTGALGRFEGFLASMISYSFLIAGPEYISMAASETVNPRKVLPKAYKGIFYRVSVFYFGGALAMGTCCSFKDPQLLDALDAGAPGAGSSAFIIAMNNMKISVLPDICNVILFMAAFSAGNSFTYCASRALYSLALQGKAPSFIAHCNKGGVPVYAVLITLAWPCLSFLQLGAGSASTVLDWIINLTTASQMLNFIVVLSAYIAFWRACKAQGIDRSQFVFTSWFQPWLSIVGLVFVVCMLGTQGYYVFLPHSWSISSFLFSYLMVFIDIILFFGWKFIKKTKFIDPFEADLISGLDEVEAHEKEIAAKEAVAGPSKRYWIDPFLNLIFGK
ncbi:unnamed protein product [Ambrosiozyma monospora]|uniref:Unnamed protein product n=1 Tax=Ambrosiozyma monospora TaxID=43982 RepID=A0A9W7DH77_AMBMO|nr:unnamed protein product [Ambrosiozyma monospora]